jgi:polyamine oxidase
LTKIIKLLQDDVFEEYDSRYKLNRKVTNITYDDQGVTVITEGGKTYTADYVIVTFSLGVLQKEVVTFAPPLPDWKRYSIMGAAFMTDLPIYLKFPSTFWDDTEYIMYGSTQRGHYSLRQNFNKLIPGSGILQAQVSGAEARRIEQLSDDAIKAEIVAVLNKMYKVTIPDPEILVTRWTTDPLHYGTYSDWSPHFSKSSHDALRAPVGRVYFAGEACHVEYFGYMEGAYFSAVDETNKLLECAEKPSECEQYKPPYDAVGCTYQGAKNYDDTALIDDGSCTFPKDQTSMASTGPVMSLIVLGLSLLFS